jgi:hypothetical protein
VLRDTTQWLPMSAGDMARINQYGDAELLSRLFIRGK